MRNRQMIVHWLMANTNAIEKRVRDGKTLLRHGRSEGVPRRCRAGCSPRCSASRRKGTTPRRRTLFETYGVHFDPALRDEVVARVDKLNLPSYTGFVQPKLEPVTRRGRHDSRRDDLVSAGSDDADARVLRGHQGKPRAVSCVATSAVRQRAADVLLASAADGGPQSACARDSSGAALPACPSIDLTLSNPDTCRVRVSCGLLAPLAQDQRALLRAPSRSAAVGAAGGRSRLRPARRPGAAGPDRADGEHERGLFFAVQAAVRSRRRRARAAAELSAGRAPDRARRCVPRALQPRVSRALGARPRRAAGEGATRATGRARSS